MVRLTHIEAAAALQHKANVWQPALASNTTGIHFCIFLIIFEYFYDILWWCGASINKLLETIPPGGYDPLKSRAPNIASTQSDVLSRQTSVAWSCISKFAKRLSRHRSLRFRLGPWMHWSDGQKWWMRKTCSLIVGCTYILRCKTFSRHALPPKFGETGWMLNLQ